jgi:hypothetical protein
MNRDSTSALIRRHLQWKALKLAGAFAILDLSDTVELDHFVAATQFCELLAGDMDLFEHDLNKSYYERFSDFCHTLVRQESKVVVDVHEIKKRGFLSNVSKPKLVELVNLCASYDKQSIYSVIGDGAGIQYEPIVKTDVLDISYKPIDTRKLNEAVAKVEEMRQVQMTRQMLKFRVIQLVRAIRDYLPEDEKRREFALRVAEIFKGELSDTGDTKRDTA